ncbi:diacylglycerol kinase family lipid kinase [Anaerolineales bacterium HSG24]|nr:diacylglycerol kinase family lipid kinase [Anaerolineales bacterium HSG24]
MTQRVKVILNPITGRPNGTAKIAKIELALQQAQLDYSLVVTEYPQHGIELARQAVLEGWPMIAAAGGDGTVNEVVNGIMQIDEDESDKPTLGIIPTGTANDLAAMLQLPKDIQGACQRLAVGESKLIDVGQVNDYFFVNNSAVGLESVVTVTQQKMRWIKGIFSYIVAATGSILTAKNWEVQVDWPSGCYEGPAILVSVGNSARTGGVFYMTPEAVVDDGLLDFVYGAGMSRWRMVTLLPRLLRGSHISHSMVIYRKTKQLKITTSPPTPIQADGEIIDHEATEISYTIIPKKLQVII